MKTYQYVISFGVAFIMLISLIYKPDDILKFSILALSLFVLDELINMQPKPLGDHFVKA
ncbi:MAG: hypothetical protein ACXAB7_01545 [Candidatus Kariarchaeaceae archaeon]